MPSKILFFNLSSLSVFFVPQRKNNYRPKLLHPDFLLVIGCMAIGFFSLIQSVKFFPNLHNSVLGFQSSITIEEVVALTNEKRQEQGLTPLIVNTKLSAAALAKAQDMLDNQYWAHTSPTGKKPWDFIKSANYQYVVAGENLARDFSQTDDMMRAWMESPTHRANIMNDRYEQIGVALVYGKLENFDTVLVVQMFGAPVIGTAQVGEGSVSGDISQTSSMPAHNSVLAIDQTDQNQTENVVNLPPGDRQAIGQKQTVAMTPASSSKEAVNLAQTQDMSVVSSTRSLNSASSIFTPLKLTKMIFLAVVMMVILTLLYDSIIIGNKKNMRLVGENLGHIILFITIAFLMIIFKGGFLR